MLYLPPGGGVYIDYSFSEDMSISSTTLKAALTERCKSTFEHFTL
jgi:hypothetical protein